MIPPFVPLDVSNFVPTFAICAFSNKKKLYLHMFAINTSNYKAIQLDVRAFPRSGPKTPHLLFVWHCSLLARKSCPKGSSICPRIAHCPFLPKIGPEMGEFDYPPPHQIGPTLTPPRAHQQMGFPLPEPNPALLTRRPWPPPCCPTRHCSASPLRRCPPRFHDLGPSRDSRRLTLAPAATPKINRGATRCLAPHAVGPRPTRLKF